MTAEKKKNINFKTIWIRYDTTCSDRHQLFIKEHSVRNQEPEYPKGKTLFVLNIPPYATKESIKHVFSQCCGPVKSVTFLQDSGFKSSYIVFNKAQALVKALSLSPEYTLTLSTEEVPVLTGIQKWCMQYNQSFENEEELKKEIDKCLIEYDQRKDKELRQEKHSERKDSEGWSVATSRKKRGKSAVVRKESTVQKILAKEEEKKQKKQLLNFYTFQIREAKKESLAELRKKFELDKKKLEQIKAKRKFRPF